MPDAEVRRVGDDDVEPPSDPVDLVPAVVADDNVYETIRLYESGVYTRDEALRRLRTERLFNQLTFKTEKALSYCRFVSSESIGEVRP